MQWSLLFLVSNNHHYSIEEDVLLRFSFKGDDDYDDSDDHDNDGYDDDDVDTVGDDDYDDDSDNHDNDGYNRDDDDDDDDDFDSVDDDHLSLLLCTILESIYKAINPYLKR